MLWNYLKDWSLINKVITKDNYEEFITNLCLDKKSELLICIPTYKSPNITSETINKFLEQKDSKFDLLVTGPSGDIEILKEKFPILNYCLTKDNYGGSGNHLINIFISLKYDYSYVMLSDNDSFLIEEWALNKMIKNMETKDLLVTYPTYYKSLNTEKKHYCSFHCCLYNVDFFRNLKSYFLSDYFLTFDDVTLQYRFFDYKKKVEPSDFSYYHPTKVNQYYSYTFMFYFTRSLFLFLIYENLSLKHKLSLSSLYNLAIVLSWFSYSIKNLDFNYFKIFSISFYQALRKKLELPEFPVSKFAYEEVNNPENANKYKEFSMRIKNILNLILPQKYIFITEFGKKKFFNLKRNI